MMSNNDGAVEIVDDQEHDRFMFSHNGETAQLLYHLNGKRLVLIHTEVPRSLAGQGIAGQLVQAAVDRAKLEGLTVVPHCPYARRWLQQHPDVAASVAIDWTPPAV